MRVAGIARQRPDERDGACLDRRLEDSLQLRSEGEHVLSLRQRAGLVDDAAGEVRGRAAQPRWQAGGEARQRDLAQRRTAGDRVGTDGIEGRELNFESLDGLREGHGEALEGAA